ncbi:MAG: 3-deoxy-D-manno-octulosonic acid transferase [Burkholderiales bacterium]|nr:3-deoxy-D-manno-octulosonic acid transferase [Burkholderiales bacterium]
MPSGAAAGLARAAYSLLLVLATPLYLLRLVWRSRREPLYRHALGERLGVARRGAPGRLWVHAVSLGETRAAAALVDELRRQRPGVRLLLTHGTATGREAGAALLQPGDAQLWLPYDTPGAVRRFFARQQPAAGVLMETETWPNLLRAARAAGVPIVLANARLSERSLARAERLAPLMRPAAACLDCAFAQTDDDGARLRRAGVRETAVLGNLKFDMAPAPELLERGRRWRATLARPVVLAASTREGEEAALVAAWHVLSAPRPLLLVVPRHPQRFDEVAAVVLNAGLVLERRSAWVDAPPASAHGADVWLGDSLGEMPLYYALADVALLGGSFAPLGGQNLIEAAACGCPVLMGPHTFNFAEAAALALEAGAAERASDLEAAVRRATTLVADGAPRRDAMAAAALAFAHRHRGAAARTATAILGRLPA